MKINREIMGKNVTIAENNIEITLTDEELREAYLAYQLKTDKEAVIDFLNDSDTDYNMDDIPDELIENIAKKFREYCGDFNETPKMESAMMAFRTDLDEYERKFKVYSREVTLTLTHTYTIKAKDEDDAERIFEAWSDQNVRQMVDDITEDALYDGDWDYGYVEEEEYENPDNADISEEDI